MTTEPPETGLVDRYSFLWPREHDRGERKGRKDRPVCLIVPVNVQVQRGRTFRSGRALRRSVA